MPETIDSMQKITLDQATEYILRDIRNRRPSFLWGGPGIGKSSLIYEIGKQLKAKVIDMRLSHMQPTDIVGIPYFNKELNKLCWAPSEELPTEEDAKNYPLIILFLDEMNCAAPAVLTAAYQLIQDRKAGTFRLPDNCIVIAAGNNEGDRGATYNMPKPLENRFKHYAIRHDYDSWMGWAADHHQHPDVIAYITWSHDKLYQFNPASKNHTFATPRTWEFVSNDLYDIDKFPTSEANTIDTVAASIGYGEAVAFQEWRRSGKNLPAPEDIVDGSVTEIKSKDISAHYQLMSSTLAYLRDWWHEHSDVTGGVMKARGKEYPERKWRSKKEGNTFLNMLDNWHDFVIANFSKEMGITSIRIESTNYFLLRAVNMEDLKTWKKLTDLYLKYVGVREEQLAQR